MDDLIGEFLEETNESLEELDLDLVNLEQNPNDNDLLSKIFRLVHTIKGTCGFLGLPRLEKCAHHAENVLGRFRDGDLAVTPEYVTLIFESIDAIKFIVAGLAETGGEPEGDDAALIAKLDAVYEGKPASDADSAEESAPAVEEPAPEPPAEKAAGELPAIEEKELMTGQVPEDELQAIFDQTEVTADYSTPAAETPAEPEPPAPEKADPPPPPPAEKAAAPAVKTEAPIINQTLRVNVDVLEDLMTMVSEMVLTRNQLMQILRSQTDSEFTAPLQRLNHVVSDLQEGVMKTRMQPIGNAWSKLPRIIRDLSLELDKEIDLVMSGQDTELDRQVLELIKDPLTHMVRNSADHGVEMPDVRKAAGKPELGTINLNAYHEGGHIIIEIIDDGKGLPMDKIKTKILEKELATEEELAEMSMQQIQQFIFNAGFSTAAAVTSVSGRGVGMDVVRTNIEKIGGAVELKSIEGKGSTFTIKIPLTLAIVSALIVESSKERFAIPQLSVRELVMASDKGDNKIEMINGTPVFRLRDRLLPLVPLSDLLKLTGHHGATNEAKIDSDDATENAGNKNSDSAENTAADVPENNTKTSSLLKGNQYIIVTQIGSYSFGIVVDRVYDTEEIVVKPVPSILRDIELFSGNTILGDGTVIMILDPNGIARATGEMKSAEDDDKDAAGTVEQFYDDSRQKTSLLLFNAVDDTPKTVPLSLVARLENIDLTTVERSGGQMMLQYRGDLMPLIPYNTSMEIGTEGEKPILVFSDKGKSMGLIVDQIVDITEEYIDVQLEGQQPGVVGSAIIDGKATDVIDVGFFLGKVDQRWFMDHGEEAFEDGDGTSTAPDGAKPKLSGKKRILLVDDSPFFRNMLSPLLNVAGYEVTSLEGAIPALELCERGAEFDLIISDIEMPEMNGFEFAEKIKTGTGAWLEVPMVALTSHATEEDIQRGKDVGFTEYVAKFDRETLLNTLTQTLTGR